MSGDIASPCEKYPHVGCGCDIDDGLPECDGCDCIRCICDDAP